MKLNNSQKKPLRRIAHQLNPVIQIGDQGVSEGVVEETKRALSDHELIKVKLNSADRDTREALTEELATVCEAELIQKIGKTVVLYRANPNANPRLSNLHRFAGGA